VRVVSSLIDLVKLLENWREEDELYVRWSCGPDADLHASSTRPSSIDALTGVVLPGLSANPLRVESWWDGRPVRLWVARRLYDYRHLREQRGPGVRPWVLAGQECARGPDNEPLVICRAPIAWISERALRECENAVEQVGADEWGPLRRL
jgi:hypothetical protein